MLWVSTRARLAMARNIIAILRGVQPAHVVKIGAALIDEGITRIEVPLNSPDAVKSILMLVNEFSSVAQLGAGTVLSIQDVQDVAATGAKLIVSPNCDPEIIAETKRLGMVSFPGALTPSECFSALKNGADGIKIFPAFKMGVDGLQALRAVLPNDAQVYAVGGVGPDNFAQWRLAGANGFGLGSCIFKPGMSAIEVGAKARIVVTAYDLAFADGC